jgi:hypothetical protein
MFDLYLGLNGETAIWFDRIALLFNADGIPATGRLRDEKNKPLADRVWHAATISQIMANPAYIGDFVWGAEVVTIPTLAIISHEIFDAVLARRAINKSESKRNVKYDYLLRGRLTCTCGRKMKAVKDVFKGHTYLYYQCNRKAFDPR